MGEGDTQGAKDVSDELHDQDQLLTNDQSQGKDDEQDGQDADNKSQGTSGLDGASRPSVPQGCWVKVSPGSCGCGGNSASSPRFRLVDAVLSSFFALSLSSHVLQALRWTMTLTATWRTSNSRTSPKMVRANGFVKWG